MKSWRRRLLLIPFLLLAGACSSGDTGPEDVASEDGLDCKIEGYPCAWADVDDEVLDASLDLADELSARLADDYEDALEWLAAQDGVAEASADHRGVRVRLDGGRPLWALTPDARPQPPPAEEIPGFDDPLDRAGDEDEDEAAASEPGGPAEPGEAAAQTRRPVAAQPAPGLWSGEVPQAVPVAVVGDNPGDKSALVLAPFFHEWAERDDAHRVAAILSGTRDYEGNVTYLADGDADRAAFGGWDAYDVVHVSTHGSQLCDLEMCRTVLETGETAERDALRVDQTRGVVLVRGGEDTEAQVALESDFFRAAYPGGLGETIVMLSACETAKGGDLLPALAGDGSVVLGWSEAVDVSVAVPASVTFFSELSERGVTTDEAMATLRERGMGAGRSSAPPAGPRVLVLIDGEWVEQGQAPEAPLGGAALRRHQGGSDLRVREVVTIQHPQSGAELVAGARVLVQPRADADWLPVRIEVDGVLDGEAGGFEVVLEVDGIEAGRWRLTDPKVSRVDDETYVVEDEVELSERIADRPEVDLEAEVSLPSGGHSRHRVADVELTDELVLRLRSELEVTARMGSGSSVVVGEARLTPVEGSPGVYTGAGPMSWERLDVTAPGCGGAQGHIGTTLAVPRAELRTAGGRRDAEVVWRGEDVDEQVVLHCGGRAVVLPAPAFTWSAVTIAAHYDLVSLAGITSTGWRPGEGETLLTWIAETTVAEGGANVRVRTELRLEAPPVARSG